MNNAQIRDKILTYDNEQTAAINDNKDKIATVEQSVVTTNQKIDDLETKLSKDYIVDYGSNENGSWEKWYSGKLVCFQNVKMASGITKPWGNVFYKPSKGPWIFPVEFIEPPIVTGTDHNTNGSFATSNVSNTRVGEVRIVGYTENNLPETVTKTMAIGFWK